VTNPCLASLLRDFALAKELVQTEEGVLLSRDNSPKLLHEERCSSDRLLKNKLLATKAKSQFELEHIQASFVDVKTS